MNNRLTVEAGVRFYAMTPQWDESLQVSTFLPDKWSAAAAPTLYVPGLDSSGKRVGVDPATGNTVVERFIGRLVPPTTDAQRFNGTAQPGQGINDTLYSGTAFKISPRLGVVYDLTGEGKTIVRGGFGIFYDRPQGNTVFNTVLTPPSMLNSNLTWGTLQNLTASTGDPYAPLGGMQPTAYDFIPPRVDRLERRRAAQADARHRPRRRLRRLQVGRPPGVRPDQRAGRGDAVQAGEPGSHPDAERRAGRDGPAHRPPAPVPGLWQHPAVAELGLRQLPRPSGGAHPPVRQGADVLGLLRLEQDPHNGRQRLGHEAAVLHEGAERRSQLLLRGQRPAAEPRGQLRLPDAQGREGRPRDPGERVADLGHLPAGRAAGRTPSTGRSRGTTAPTSSAAPTSRPAST